MGVRHLLIALASILGLLGIEIATAAAAATVPPNIVFILIDDLGWADVASFGSRYYETPHIDRLAARGMRFTNAYAAAAICSPTRASILTGKYPARLHITDYIPGDGQPPGAVLRIPQWQQFLPPAEVTIAEALKAAGYVSASIGKWHLGTSDYYPEHHGFDVNIAGTQWGQPASYFWPYAGPSRTVEGLAQGGQEGEYLTDRLTDEAVRFIERNRGRPFFLYLSHYAVHTPLQAKPSLVEKYRRKPAAGGQGNPVYAAMIESVDDSVGRLLATIDALGIGDRTLIIFASDNGGLTLNDITSNAPLRGGKGAPYEGGIRVPLIVTWPGMIEAGSTCGVPVSSIDFFATILDITGAARRPVTDGVSLVPLLRQAGPLHREALYWHYPHYWHDTRPFGAVRAGDWKAIEEYEGGRVELYNLHEDLSETHDLAGENPTKTGELRALLHQWRQAVGAQMPIALGTVGARELQPQ